MTKLGIFVGEEIWNFFDEIFKDLAGHFRVEVFQRKRYNTPLLYGRLNRLAYRRGIETILRRNDLCFFEWASELLVIASHMPKRCPIVTRLHSFEIFEWAPKINWDAIDRIILVSKSMQAVFNELYPDHADKTIVIYNGIALDRFRLHESRDFQFNLGMLCAISPIKRVYEMILTLSALNKLGHQARLYIAGEPKGDLRYMAALDMLVKKLDLQESVILNGYVKDTPAWLQNIDIFISNSFWEGQQVALIEALASGCFCLSHAWPGSEEVLPPENLYLTENELIQKIISYEGKSTSEKFELQSHMRSIACQRFDIEKTKAGIRQVLEHLDTLHHSE